MTDGLTVSGGAGGMGATLADLRAEAHIMRDAGGDLLGRAGTVSKMAVHEDLLAAALICPDLVPGVEAALASAAAGPDGLAVRGAALTTTGTLVDATASTYEAADQASAWALDKIKTVGGFAAGLVLPAAAVVGGTGLAAFLATHPTVAVALATYAKSGKMSPHLQRSLYENPWLLEALTRTAPGLLQGTAFSLSTLVPGGPGALSLLTGGKWPTTDYEDAVAGLIGLGNLGGAFTDTGSFTLDAPRDADGNVVSHTLTDWSQSHAVRDVFRLQGGMDGKPFVTGDGDDSTYGQLMIVKVPQPDGSSAYVVQIPGTEDWSPTRSTNPVDLTTNLQLMTQRDAAMRHLVTQAIDQHVPAGSPVMLTGHSQGGITAASIASDPALVHQYNIKSVVTGGSPIGRFDIDPSVSVLSVEHTQDPVPMLDGTANPDRANWTTVRRDLPASDAASQGVPNPGNAHLTSNYVKTGETIDASDDPSLEAWRRQNAQFFNSTGQADATRIPIVPTKP